MKITIEVDGVTLAFYRVKAKETGRTVEEELSIALQRDLIAEPPLQFYSWQGEAPRQHQRQKLLDHTMFKLSNKPKKKGR